MARQLIKNDVPELWRQRAKAGLCPVCGKDPSQFKKSMRVYCSKKCRETYASKYTHWTEIRDKIFERDGKVCAECGVSEDKAEKKNEQIEKEIRKKWIKNNQDYIEKMRDKLLIGLSEQFEREFKEIMSDEYIFKNKIEWEVREELEKLREGKGIVDLYNLRFCIDHIRAIVNDGEMFDEGNLQVLCENCHKKKTKEDMLERKRRKIKTKKLKNRRVAIPPISKDKGILATIL